MKFLDSAGVSHLISLIKSAFVAKVEGKGLSTNDYDNTAKGKVDAIPSNPKYTDTTYESKTAASGGTAVSLVTTGEKYTWNNKGTYSKPSGGIPKTDLASAVQASLDKADSALQSHQDISGKADKSATVSTVEWDSTNKKLTKTINGTKTDVVSAATIKAGLSLAKGDVSLGNVTNDAQVKRSEMGVANGVATLDSEGKVPSSQLPSYVDDVIEGYLYSGKFYKESTHTTEITGESDKIYVDLSTNKTYRWGGTSYAEISSSLAIGTTSSTAFRGDYGNTAYSHATDSGRLTTAQSSGLYKIAVTAQGHVAGVTAVQKSDITALGIPASDTDTKVTAVGNHYTPAKNADSTKSASGATGTAGTTVQVVTGIEMDAKGHVTGIISGAATDTTYSDVVAGGASGLMTGADKTKLNGIATGATAVTESTVSGWGFTKNTGTITSHQTIKQNGITGATRNNYAECSIAAATAAKTATVTAGTPTLEKGLHVFVKFSNKNTASNPTLNINSTGAKAIWYDGAAISTDPAVVRLLDGVCELEYDGTQWHLLNKMAALSNDDIDTLWASA